MKAKLVCRGVCVALLVGSLSSRADQPTLTWGADSQGGAPYVFQDPLNPNLLTGFEAEFASLLATKLGKAPRPRHGPWDKLLELLARGDFDVVINGIEVADEKKRVVALSTPYFSAAEVLTIRKGDQAAPRSLQTLATRKIGTLPGSMAERIATQAGADVRTYEGGQGEIYDDLKIGRIDAVLLDAPVAHYYADIDAAFEAVPGDFGHVEYAVATKLDDRATLEAINRAIAELINDGSLRALYERWGLWSPAVAGLFKQEASPRTPPIAFEQWRAAVGTLPPFWERVRDRYPALLPHFARGAALTLATSLCAMLLAVLLGVTLAMTRRFGPKALQLVAVAYIEFFRGTPLLVQLTMLYFGLPELGVRLDPFVAGTLALGLNYAAAEAENYRAGLESVPRGQLEASTVLGLSTWQTLRHVVAPQAFRISLPPMTNDFIALLKDSSLVSLVTLTELTKTYSNLANSTRDHLGLGALVAVWYLLIGLPFARLAKAAERRFGQHLHREAA